MSDEMKFLTIAELWSRDKKKYVKESTYTLYMMLLNKHILPYFGNYTLIKEDDCQAFVFEKLEEGLQIKTVKDIIIILKMIINYGAKYNYIPACIMNIKYPKSFKKPIEVLSRENHKRLIEYLIKSFSFKNLGILICLSTGLRIGELCALRWKDINIEDGILEVKYTVSRIYHIDGDEKYTTVELTEPKTVDSKREIPLSNDLLKIVRPLKKIVNDDCFILSNSAKPTEPRTYRSYYKRLLAKLDIPDIKFHGLRHSFATRCIETSGVDYKTVSVILGHSNITTTMNLYVHPNKEQKKKCINKMLKSL